MPGWGLVSGSLSPSSPFLARMPILDCRVQPLLPVRVTYLLGTRSPVEDVI